MIITFHTKIGNTRFVQLPSSFKNGNSLDCRDLFKVFHLLVTLYQTVSKRDTLSMAMRRQRLRQVVISKLHMSGINVLYINF